MVQPLINSSAMATWVLTCTISGVSPAQRGYRPWSQPNSSAFCTPGMARVRLWYMWWWVFTMPGVTRWWRASITSSACCMSAGSSAVGPMKAMVLSRIKIEASCSSRDVSSWVAMVWAWWISRVRMTQSIKDKGHLVCNKPGGCVEAESHWIQGTRGEHHVAEHPGLCWVCAGAQVVFCLMWKYLPTWCAMRPLGMLFGWRVGYRYAKGTKICSKNFPGVRCSCGVCSAGA